jgi:arabinan endo-1,5-alpha-L-arabinosidase
VRHNGYFYLFTSWDLCCRGLKSTYKTMVGRSKSIIGPYVDANGRKLADGGGTELLSANSRWLGPGGGSVYQDSQNRSLIVFHVYDSNTGRPSMQLSTIDWTGGWPHADLER